MKKLLSILASVTLTASASTAVVSCSTETSTMNPDSYVNNNLNNILGASLEKAKSVIINNEYGVDTSKVVQQQSGLKVSDDGLKNINYQDLTNKKDSTVGQLVSQYYGNINDTNSNTNTGSNVDINGTNGVTSTIDYLLQQVMNTLQVPTMVQNAIFRYKNLIIGQLALSKGSINMSVLDDINSDMYNQAISGGEYLINTAITMGLNYLSLQVQKEGDDTNGWGHVVAKVIKTIFTDKDTFADTTLPGVFSSDTMKMIKGVAGALLNGQDPSYKQPGVAKGSVPSPVQNSVYQNSDLTLPDFINSDSTKTFKLSDYFNKFQDIQKGWQDDKLASVNTSDIHKELFASIDRILHILLNPILFNPSNPKQKLDANNFSSATDYTSGFVSDLQNTISKVIGGLVSNTIDKNSLLNPDLKKDQLGFMGIGWEVLRDISLMNAQFSMFEDKYDVSVIDSQHLFGNDDNGDPQTNYQYLNGFINDVKVKGKKEIPAKYPTLAETPYLKAGDEPINLNYFFSNLNYYLGGLSNKSDESVYRIQKLLFITFNDPAKSTMEDGSTSSVGWVDKQSDLLDLLVKTGLQVGKAVVDAKDAAATGSDKKTMDAVKAALDSISEPDMNTIEDDLLKPLILGLINGDSFQPLLQLLDGALHGALGLDSLKDLFGSLKALGINIDDITKAVDRLADNKEVGKDTIHSLFTVDFRSILKPLKIIPQAWMDKLFGPDLPVNLMTIVNMPLSKILSMFNVPGFEGGKISPIGDYFTIHSIPWLINFMNGRVLNNIQGADDVPLKYVDYPKDKDGKPDTTQKPDFTKSLKARDINFQALYDLFISIVGSNNSGKYVGDTDNIFSRLLKDLISSDVSGDLPNTWKIKLDPRKAVNDLGIMGQVKKEAPQTKPNNNSFADDDSTLPEGKYDDSAKTIEFDSDKIKSDWTLKQPTPYEVTPTFSDGKVVLQLKKSIEIAKAQDLTFTFADDKKNEYTGKVNIPALYGGAGTDLQIKYNSITGAFYRINLPKIEQDQPDAKDGTDLFTMHDRYLDADFLGTDYDNMVDLIKYFNSPGDYLKFITDILRNQDAFEFDYDPQSIKYFASNRNLIKGLTFIVTYKNYVVGETNQYIFTVSRDSNIEAFKIDKLITNKID